MPQPKEEIVWRKKNKLLVLLNTKSGHYYTLNDVASALWFSMFVDKKPLDEVVELICQNFDNPPERSIIEQDCKSLIEEWTQENLIE